MLSLLVFVQVSQTADVPAISIPPRATVRRPIRCYSCFRRIAVVWAVEWWRGRQENPDLTLINLTIMRIC